MGDRFIGLRKRKFNKNNPIPRFGQILQPERFWIHGIPDKALFFDIARPFAYICKLNKTIFERQSVASKTILRCSIRILLRTGIFSLKKGDAAAFEALAMEAFRYQSAENDVYGRFIKALRRRCSLSGQHT